MAKVLFVLLVPNEVAEKKLKDPEENEKIKLEDDNKNLMTEKSKLIFTVNSEETTESIERDKKAVSGWNFEDANKKTKINISGSTAADKSSDQSVTTLKNSELLQRTEKKEENVDELSKTKEENGIKPAESKGQQSKKSKECLMEMDAPDGGERKRKNSLIAALFHPSDSCSSMSDKLAQGEHLKNRKKSLVAAELTDEEKKMLVSLINDNKNVLEKVKNTLVEMNITGVQWSTTEDALELGMFVTDDGETCEILLKKLSALKISINVFPASISIASLKQKEEAEHLKQILDQENKLAEKVSEFKKSIKSRLVVAQVVDAVKSDAVFTFDFLMLVMLASMVAVMGLLEASSVALVASMLISPLMGPIIAGVFGTVIRNRDLLMVGFTSEMKGLCLCILIGFATGFIPAILESAGLQWRATDNWPTIEMSSRGSLRSLLVGVLIAIPSGAGVALSILGGKVGSLVGVAISASLLPPAVNAGLLWANAIVVAIRPLPTTQPLSTTSGDGMNQSSQVLGNGHLQCPFYVNNDFIPEYSCDMSKESAVLGVVSLLLTILNIICIIIMGIVVLKIKEVAPIRTVASAEHDFFVEDIKIARESYQTAKGQDSYLLGKRFLEEYKTVKNDLGVEDDSDEDEDELHRIVEEVEESADVKEIIDHMPHRPKRWRNNKKWTGSALMNDDKHDDDRVYKTIQIVSPKQLDDSIQLRRRKHPSGTDRAISLDVTTPDSTYLTIHRLPSPRAMSGKFHIPKTGRFKVDRVAEKSPSKSDKGSVTPINSSSIPKIVLETQPLLSVNTNN
ncbi:hypothetical protein Bpfe_011319 [Biomphalaria pfeifferi]|uniref:Uncharacterized protein n=1 Tax=Biomphalaria pfeifferi TaxID=112525 RepID=A0AAD8BS74_BIOPF|nr:hypothetical protein Bpfe_011319 [Biomphalaria pfeifferi]